MEALTLLHEVAQAYRDLRTLSCEVALITESGDEGASNRGELRGKFFYVAPDRLRYEPLGKKGMFHVSDGSRLHTVFAHHRGRQYHSHPLDRRHLPHFFNPDFPMIASDQAALLFPRIDESVESAELLREEQGCFVLSVAYRARHPGLVIAGSGILYWVDAATRLVVRQEGDVGHRFPTEDEISWSHHTVMVRELRVNESISGEVFDFVPPPDAVPQADFGPGISGGGGGGFAEGGSVDNPRRLEHRGLHHWEGETLVEVSTWKWRGMKLTFERRLTFSADGNELQIEEKIAGPAGKIETASQLRVG